MADLNQLELIDHSGDAVKLGALWTDHPVALVFLRHYGCIFCREQVLMLNEAKDEIPGGGEVVVVGMGTPAHAAQFKSEADLDFKLLVDNERKLYNQLGMRSGSWMEVIGPANMLRAVRARRRGARQGRPKQDPKQLGGAAVVAPGGKIIWSYISKNSSDTVAAGKILGELASANADMISPEQ